MYKQKQTFIRQICKSFLQKEVKVKVKVKQLYLYHLRQVHLVAGSRIWTRDVRITSPAPNH